MQPKHKIAEDIVKDNPHFSWRQFACLFIRDCQRSGIKVSNNTNSLKYYFRAARKQIGLTGQSTNCRQLRGKRIPAPIKTEFVKLQPISRESAWQAIKYIVSEQDRLTAENKQLNIRLNNCIQEKAALELKLKTAHDEVLQIRVANQQAIPD